MIHALRSMTRCTRVVLALLAAVAVLAGLAVATAGPAEAAPSAPAVAAIGDCKDAPTPARPLGNAMAPPRPGNYSDADPFKKGSDVTIAQVYGNGYSWQTYDNGCKPGSGIMPGVFTGLSNIGLEFSSTWVAWGRMFQTSVINPESWIGKMDPAMEKATNAVADGFWFPWMPVAMLLVAALLLFRSSKGQYAQVITGLGWSMVVLIIVSGLISYPRDAPRMVDDGIATATTAIATSFSESDMTAAEKKAAEPDVTVEDEKRIQRGDTPTEDKGAAALDAMEKQWDEIDRETSYRTWLSGTFGDPDSATAKKYGPRIFKASHMTWAESKAYSEDPEGDGKEIIEKKQKAYEKAAGEVKDADPVAYDHLTGNQGFDRISASLTGFLTTIITTFFLVLSGIGMACAFVVIRLLVPFAPAAGPIFLIDKVKDFAMDKLGMVASLIVMGPLYLVTGLVVLRFNSAAMTSDLSTLWKFFVIALAGVLAWKLVKPGALGGRGLGVGRMMRRAAATAAGVRLGNAGNNNNKNPDDDEKDEKGGQDSPVHDERRPAPYRKFYPGRRQPDERGLPPGTAPGPVRETQDLGQIHAEPYTVSSGVFTPREQQQGALSRRETLALSRDRAQVDEGQRPIHDRRNRPFVSDALPDEESSRTRPHVGDGPASSRELPPGSPARDEASDPDRLVDEVSDSRRTPTTPGGPGQVEDQRQYRVSGDPTFARLYGGQQQPVSSQRDVEESVDKDRLVDDAPRSRENVPPPPTGVGPRATADAGGERSSATEAPSSSAGMPYERSRQVDSDLAEEPPSSSPRGGRVMGQDEAIPVDAHEVNYVNDPVTGERVFQVYRPESMRRTD